MRDFAALSKLISYDPQSGIFTWLPRPRSMFPSDWAANIWNKRFANKIAGSDKGGGYISLTFRGVAHRSHRLAFYMSHGYLPKQVDHVNGDRADNRISNLREATSAQNCANRRMSTRNTSGQKGVRLFKRTGKWVAYVTKDGRQHHCGYFNTEAEAMQARATKAKELHGEFVYQEPEND